MGSGIAGEIRFFIHSFLLGIGMVIFYDIFRILRRVIPHRNFLISLEDLFYWFVCGIAIFLMLYQENDGIIRWFCVAGMALGMFLYNGTISRYTTKGISWILCKIIKGIGFVFLTVSRPFRFVFGRCTKVRKQIGRKVTKRCAWQKRGLKKLVRTFKLYITKH